MPAYDDQMEADFRRQGREQREAEAAAKELKVEVKRNRSDTDPPHDFFNVVISGVTGEWRETVGSEADLEILLRGVKAGASMMGGHVSIGDIPTEPFMI